MARTSAEWKAAWQRFWFGEEPARNLAAARMLLAGAALWMVLSRPELPEIAGLPAEFWTRVSPARRLRFLMLGGAELERVLYAALTVALVWALVGILPRTSCLLAGLLLYHFAPFETIIRSANPYLRGLTIPTLGLLVLSFSRCGDALSPGSRGRRGGACWEYRWPLALVQVLFCQVYLFAGYAKLVTSGFEWASGENMRGYLLLLNQGLMAEPGRSLGYALAEQRWACSVLGMAGLAFESAFPLVLFSRRARLVLLPLAVLFHLGNSLLFRISFQNLPLLLLFVDWSGRPPSRPAE